ncbi:DUF2938 domain-containing protein [Curvibacter delicatus]|jgi:hypothetical protein|uniref:DUF2938 domain-containing protein n=1 Tax=Curvibacter delicatus TaxID=80879 RepID=UPI000835352B|nr:DUF2938 domain-containing protein [Curvibacter delicatus]
MTPFDSLLLRTVVIGIGATAVMDLWLTLLKTLGLPTLNFALLGRWVGHMPRGRWAHQGIAKAAPVPGELALGWAAHYVTGITFALLLTALAGPPWLRTPSLAPALCFGIGTVVLPLFVMQPAMGAGFASSRTPTPVLNVLKSLANHTVFGLGLYAAALAIVSLTGA